ncbi:MAG: DUF488 family protein [Candidatus Omnitrophica bacterium]|nr:DUF488 family protein [Candidatus Omnitrophota bacterium]
MKPRTHIRVKRIYEAAEPSDGVRVLVDRLWPRGVGKEGARLDAWMKELTPSTPLRRWFHADPARRGGEFAKRYEAELATHREALEQLRLLARGKRLTLVTAAADVEHSHVPVLLQRLEAR